jgi:hypothetical protein
MRCDSAGPLDDANFMLSFVTNFGKMITKPWHCRALLIIID